MKKTKFIVSFETNGQIQGKCEVVSMTAKNLVTGEIVSQKFNYHNKMTANAIIAAGGKIPQKGHYFSTQLFYKVIEKIGGSQKNCIYYIFSEYEKISYTKNSNDSIFYNIVTLTRLKSVKLEKEMIHQPHSLENIYYLLFKEIITISSKLETIEKIVNYLTKNSLREYLTLCPISIEHIGHLGAPIKELLESYGFDEIEDDLINSALSEEGRMAPYSLFYDSVRHCYDPVLVKRELYEKKISAIILTILKPVKILAEKYHLNFSNYDIACDCGEYYSSSDDIHLRCKNTNDFTISVGRGAYSLDNITNIKQNFIHVKNFISEKLKINPNKKLREKLLNAWKKINQLYPYNCYHEATDTALDVNGIILTMHKNYTPNSVEMEVEKCKTNDGIFDERPVQWYTQINLKLKNGTTVIGTIRLDTKKLLVFTDTWNAPETEPAPLMITKDNFDIIMNIITKLLDNYSYIDKNIPEGKYYYDLLEKGGDQNMKV